MKPITVFYNHIILSYMIINVERSWKSEVNTGIGLGFSWIQL